MKYFTQHVSRGTTVQKIDLKKDLKSLYQPSARDVVLVEVPSFTFLMIDGQGDPNTSAAYAQAVETLFSVSYTAKFMIKKGKQAIDYAVMPLEGLWWADDNVLFSVDKKADWKWTAMIMQPSFVEEDLLAAAMDDVVRKKKVTLPPSLRIECFAEGPSAQIMHIGPFTAEGPTVERLHAGIHAMGKTPIGRHHEIYLSDIRKAAPEKWKTIIRQPVR